MSSSYGDIPPLDGTGGGSGGGGGGSGTVTSVALASSTPSLFDISGSPITTNGTIVLQEALQSSGLIFAGPTSGQPNPAAPTFRRLQADEIPVLPYGTGNGTVTSVNLASSASWLSTSGGPITSAGTLTVRPVAQSSGQVLASASSGGNSDTPEFRYLASADIPVIDLASTQKGGITGVLAVRNGGSSSASWAPNAVLLGNNISAFKTVAPGAGGNFLMSDGTIWTSSAIVLATGNGTVTSVDLASSAPSIFSTSGGPITTAGTLTLSLIPQSSGLVFAGSTAADSIAPLFRRLQFPDLPPIFDTQGNMNTTLSATTASSTLTLNVITFSNNTPTLIDPGHITFRNPVANVGLDQVIKVRAGTSLLIPMGAGLGTLSGQPHWIYVYALNQSGTPNVGVSMRMFDEGRLNNTIPINSTANSSTALYSNIGSSAIPIRCIGRIYSQQATSGLWSAPPIEITTPPFRKPCNTAVRYKTAATQTIGSSSSVVINFDEREFDVYDKAYVTTGTTWEYLVREPGVYNISANIKTNNFTWVAGEILGSAVQIDGVILCELGRNTATAAGNYVMSCGGSTMFSLVPGQKIRITASSDHSPAVSLSGDKKENFCAIWRYPDELTP